MFNICYLVDSLSYYLIPTLLTKFNYQLVNNFTEMGKICFFCPFPNFSFLLIQTIAMFTLFTVCFLDCYCYYYRCFVFLFHFVNMILIVILCNQIFVNCLNPVSANSTSTDESIDERERGQYKKRPVAKNIHEIVLHQSYKRFFIICYRDPNLVFVSLRMAPRGR